MALAVHSDGLQVRPSRTCRSPLLCMPLELALADWLSWSRSAASSASFAARSASSCDVLPCGAGKG